MHAEFHLNLKQWLLIAIGAVIGTLQRKKLGGLAVEKDKEEGGGGESETRTSRVFPGPCARANLIDATYYIEGQEAGNLVANSSQVGCGAVRLSLVARKVECGAAKKSLLAAKHKAGD